ncbi:MAG: hypothetical protein G01um10147_1024 [Microgenomates group bacterium Gr01-1014_7]|nr:MAG: hypothetical protein G01um10147_1024 [Microgenomates group bacterium Gr01-1014_7]
MKEALDGVYGEVIDLEDYMARERKRMDQLRPNGRQLYDAADEVLKGEIGDGSVRVSDTVTIIFQHPTFISDESGRISPGSLDIWARVHLETDDLIDFPDHTRRSGIVIVAEFSGPYNDSRGIFASTEDGDVINQRGDFATDQEIGQAASILSGFRTP